LKWRGSEPAGHSKRTAEWRQAAGQPFRPDSSLIRSTVELTDELAPNPRASAEPRAVQNKIWIDLDSSPHDPFFAPIVEELKTKESEVILAA
jgi:hypothetical protein